MSPQDRTTLRDQAMPFRLEPLAPIHVGSGNLLDPMSYVIDTKGEYLHFIDLPAWVEDHPDPDRLAQEFGSKPMGALRGLVRQELDTALYSFAKARIFSSEVVEIYERELSKQRGQNQLFIDPASKNPLTGALVLPGSSIKGAMRTPIIDYLDKNYDLNLKRDSRNVERTLESVLGKITENAFQNLKVGDFEAMVGDSSIVTAKEMREKAGEKKNVTPKNPCEVTRNLLMDGKAQPVYGKITIGAHNGKARNTVLGIDRRDRGKHYSESWTIHDLLALCNKFYGLRYLKEAKKFYALPHFADAKKHLDKLTEALKSLGTGQALIRLGHYSHVECVTIEHNDPQRRRLPNGTLLPSGTTRTLAHGLFPFGWARLSLCSWEEYEDALADKRRHDQSMTNEREARRAEVRRQAMERVRQRQELERQKAERQAEIERLEQEKAEQEKILAELPPEDRLLRELETGKMDNTAIGTRWNDLMALQGEQLLRAAKALKTFWQKNKDWDVKPRKKKQYDKVQQVKKILGEA
jgi:CRISPR-associated protein Csm5